MKNYVNGEIVELTPEEVAEHDRLALEREQEEAEERARNPYVTAEEILADLERIL